MIISVEGMKGTGKSTIANLLSLESGIPVVEKYTQGKCLFPDWVESLREEYWGEFNDATSSLGLQHYSNLFSRLEGQCGESCILEKGLITAASSGYYGYVKNREKVPFAEYMGILKNVFEESCKHYEPFACDTTFMLLECSPEIARARVYDRLREVPSEVFFIEHQKKYNEMHSSFIQVAMQLLLPAQSRFIYAKNETPEDLEKILHAYFLPSKKRPSLYLG